MRLFLTALFLAAATSVAASSDKAKFKIHRQPDSFWDRIVAGDQVQADSHEPGAHKRVEGQLANYQLRVRHHDPSSLGIDKVKQLSGYLDDMATDKHLFYWFFESRNNSFKDPVVLWLNGGPGCSSSIGLFGELGPATMPNMDLKPISNPFSWNTKANLIFIDQPINSGFSYGAGVNSTLAAADDIYALLTLFFHAFPQYAKQDFFIAGESYAGHYIPAMGHQILSHKHRNINLKGLLIGNGLTDPYTQYAYYRPMACGKGGQKAVLPESDCKKMEDAEPECRKQIKQCYDTGDDNTCKGALDYCNRYILDVYQGNAYDIVHPNGTGKQNHADVFLNQEHTKKVLGVEVDRDWESCTDAVWDQFAGTGDWMRPQHLVIPEILAQIPVGIYAGDIDYICNWLGNLAWVDALNWPGKAAFHSAKVQALNVHSGRRYGNVRTAEGLSFMQFYGAGHTVPEYEGEGSLDLLNRFMAGEWSK